MRDHHTKVLLRIITIVYLNTVRRHPRRICHGGGDVDGGMTFLTQIAIATGLLGYFPEADLGQLMCLGESLDVVPLQRQVDGHGGQGVVARLGRDGVPRPLTHAGAQNSR